MNPRRRRLILLATSTVAMAIVVAGVLLATGRSGAAKPQWTIADLGTLRGSRDSYPVAMNDRGEVVGMSSIPGSTPYSLRDRAFVVRGGKLIDLGTLGGRSTEPRAINDRGQVVGESETSSHEQHAFLWENGRMIDLGTLGGRGSVATAINDRGEIVGGSATAQGPGHAFMWQRGKMMDLGALGDGGSSATAINERGQVIGVSLRRGQQRGFLWQRGKMIDLGTLGGQTAAVFRGLGQQEVVEPIAIDDAGAIVGYVRDKDGAYLSAFRWSNGRMSGFGSFDGQPNKAIAINARGQILVQTVPPTDRRADAYLWENGRLTRLPSLGRTETTRMNPATFAVGLNDRGQVVGTSLVAIGHKLPFVWEDGEMTALPTLSGQDTAPTSDATAIDSYGQIVGSSYTSVRGHNELHVVEWTRRRD